jgi:hypothetical protein
MDTQNFALLDELRAKKYMGIVFLLFGVYRIVLASRLPKDKPPK